MIKKEEEIWGQGDGSVAKALAIQAWGLGFEFQEPVHFR